MYGVCEARGRSTKKRKKKEKRKGEESGKKKELMVSCIRDARVTDKEKKRRVIWEEPWFECDWVEKEEWLVCKKRTQSCGYMCVSEKPRGDST